MAAPLSSGTAFHLCPGDLRSAWVIDRVDKVSSAESHSHHHNHHHTTVADEAGAASVEKSSADAGCTFAGSGGAPVAFSAPAIGELSGDTSLIVPAEVLIPRQRSWLRPPARSPPA